MADKMWAVTLPIFVIFAVANAQNQVPVVIWGNSGASLATPLAGHGVSNVQFISKYIKRSIETGSQNLVTFIQDKLSLEDITQNADVFNQNSDGGAFHNLKDALSQHSSLHLPSVASPVDAVNKMKKAFKGKIHELKAPYNLDDLELDQDGNNMIIARLPNMDSGEAVKNIDNVLGSVTKNLASRGTFTAFYTADESSKIEGFGNMKTGRHLLQAVQDSSSNATFFNVSGCIFFYAQSIELQVAPKTNPATYTTYPLPNAGESEVVKAESNCVNDTGLLTVKYKSASLPTDIKSFSMKLEYVLRAGYWNVASLNASFEVNNTVGEDVGYLIDVVTPSTFSYHCSDNGGMPMLNSNQTEDIVTRLKFREFQTQFDVKANEFGYPNDCVGFFTIPILSGLIVTLVLMLVLAFGIGMIANINTMDRFDDPKGKTISVNVGE